MVGEVLDHADHEVNVVVLVRGDDLEGSEELSGSSGPVLLLSDLINWHILKNKRRKILRLRWARRSRSSWGWCGS